MRIVSPLLLCSLLIVTSMAPILGGSGQLDQDEQSSVQAKSLIDFEVTSIEIGTGSVSAMEWSQPDGRSGGDKRARLRRALLWMS